MSEEFSSLEHLFELHEQRQQLEHMLSGGGTPNRDLLEIAFAAANEKIATLSQEQSIQEQLQEMVSPVLKEIEEIDNLGQFVVTGLLKEEDIAERKQSVMDRLAKQPRVLRAWEIVQGTLFAETVEVIEPVITEPKPNADDTESSAERLKPDVIMTVRDDAILIGKGGRFVKTSERRSDTQKDYSKYRITFLKTLVKNQGELLPVKELWDKSFDEPFNKNTMTQIKSWLDKLTYRRQPMIEHNGKRGPASAYGIMNFSASIVSEEVTRKPIQTMQSTKETISPVEESSVKRQKSSEAAGSPQANAELVDTQVCFPLSLYESATVAAFLQFNEKSLMELGFEPISKEDVRELADNPSITDQSRLVTMVNAGVSSVGELRMSAIQKLKTFFTDDSLVLDTVSAMSVRDHRYKLFSYLIDFDAEDRWAVLEKLVSAQQVLKYEVETGKWDGYRVIGSPRRVVTIETPAGSTMDIDLTDDLSLNHPLEIVEVVETAPDLLDSSELTDGDIVDIHLTDPLVEQPTEAVSEIRQSSEPQWFIDIKHEVDEAIASLLEKNVLEEVQLTAHRASNRYPESRKYGTIEAVQRLEKIGMLSLLGVNKTHIGEVELSRVQRVLMLIQNTNQQLISQRQRRKKIVDYIESKLTEIFPE